MGGFLRALEQDPVVSSSVVVAGGSVVSALTGCSAGPNSFLSVFAVVKTAVFAGMPNVIVVPSPPIFFHSYLPSIVMLRTPEC